jgi:hypothetical protein|tara:strand:- start:363 stop:728 length:366 start_codon:yes stop_codon:yes gene_type:complete
MKDKDWDYIARLEDAIARKYGDMATHNPNRYWDEEKEKEYLKQLKEQNKKDDAHSSKKDYKEVSGVLISTKLVNKSGFDICPICKKYGLNVKDEISMYKYECCCTCYIKNIEGREKNGHNV